MSKLGFNVLPTHNSSGDGTSVYSITRKTWEAKDRICNQCRIHYMLQCVHVSTLFYPIPLEGRRDITDEFVTIPFYFLPFSAAPFELAKSIPAHPLILSSHLFFCLPLLLFPLIVPCRIVLVKQEDLEMWPNHLNFGYLTWVSSSYSPMAAWIFLRTSSLVKWSLYEMFNSLR